MKEVLIFVDNREAASGILDYFEQYHAKIQKKMLVCGDYIVSDRVVVERKTTEDFVQSIIDGRLFSQVKNMKDNFEKPVLIIEGYGKLYERLHPNTVRGAFGSLMLDYSVPVIFTRDQAETAGFVFWLAKREQNENNRDVPLRIKQKKLSEKEQQEFLVAGLPGISVVRARSLLKHFKTPEAVFSASEEELMEVDKIGPKLAKLIKNTLSNAYKK